MKKIIITMILLIVASSLLQAKDLFVTVYNSNLGVISESRTLDFKKGLGTVSVIDIPSGIDAASVRFDISDKSKKISILEQNFAFDLVSPEKMYTRYIDEKIELINENGNVYSGTLISYEYRSVTLLDKSGKIRVVQLDKIAEVNFPALPDGLITRPTLFWRYSSNFEGKVDGKLSYQTSGMSWNAEYIGKLNQDKTELSLSGWASMNNSSGKTYENATLKLVAGDIHRAQKPINLRGGRAAEVMALDLGFEEKEFFEYHLYSLPRKVTLANNEQKQISLFDPAVTDITKNYLYKPDFNAENIEVILKFNNSSDKGLGMPLPAGRVRIFKADEDESLILLGEDNIKHTPKNENVELNVGNAFDLKGKLTELNRQMITSKIEEKEFSIELTNRKDEKVSIDVEKQFHGNWEIITTNFEYEKKDANTIKFTASIPVDSKESYKFTVRYSYR
jgi:hypothetical protein